MPACRTATNLFVVGRGFGLGIAQEAALKLKETCGLHAEAFSAAEVKHGPMALVRRGFPVLMLSQNDETPRRHRGAGERLRRARRRCAARRRPASTGATALPTIAAHPAIEPMLMIQSFYRLAVERSRSRAASIPTRRRICNKVTETL